MKPYVKHRLRAIVCAVVLGLLAPLLVAVAPAHATVWPSQYEAQVLSLVNVQRARHGLPRLRPSACADRFAERWARTMMRTGSFRHQNIWPILGVCHRTRAAENIAVGYSTARAVVDAWLRSPGHRRNILDPRLRYLGVAAVRDGEGTWWVVQDFTG